MRDRLSIRVRVSPGSQADIRVLAFSRPCYAGLMNNISTRLMRLKLNAWQEGTEDYVKHHVLEEYLQETSRKHGVEDITLYNTRVEHVMKEHGKWQVQTTTLRREGTKLQKAQANWVIV